MPNSNKVGIIQDDDYNWMKTECSSDGKYLKDEDIVEKIDEICIAEKHRIKIRKQEEREKIRNVVIICSSICGALLFVSLCFIGWFYRCHIKHLYEKLMTVLYHHELFKKLVHIYLYCY